MLFTVRMGSPSPTPPPPTTNQEGWPGEAARDAARTESARARRCPTCQQPFSGEARFCPFDGDALANAPDWDPASDPLIGTCVDGRYEVVSVIGEGGMGTVYEVRHTALGRRFALKVLRRDLADSEHTQRFIQEAKASAAIGHVNIVQVSDFGVLPPREEGMEPIPYFVMEHLAGISLSALLRAETTLDPLRAAQILRQCASGLAAAHEAGVIHRDLKPDNVFLTRSGDHEFVKLLDFGVAKMAGVGRLTRAGMVFGTPHYMSPEQAAGQAVDGRADIYALGIIFYECLAGRVPFEADTYMGVLTKHMFATPDPIDRVVVDPSRLGALAPIAMRCLEKSPSDRFAHMGELESALDDAIADALLLRSASGRPLPQRRASTSPPPYSPRAWVLSVVLASVALAVVAVFMYGPARWGGRSPETYGAVVDAGTALQGAQPGPAASAPMDRTDAGSAQSADTKPPPTPSPADESAKPVAPPPPAGPRGPYHPPGGLRPRDDARDTKKAGSEVIDPWRK